jgi:hypothetical protein
MSKSDIEQIYSGPVKALYMSLSGDLKTFLSFRAFLNYFKKMNISWGPLDGSKLLQLKRSFVYDINVFMLHWIDTLKVKCKEELEPVNLREQLKCLSVLELVVKNLKQHVSEVADFYAKECGLSLSVCGKRKHK